MCHDMGNKLTVPYHGFLYQNPCDMISDSTLVYLKTTKKNLMLMFTVFSAVCLGCCAAAIGGKSTTNGRCHSSCIDTTWCSLSVIGPYKK